MTVNLLTRRRPARGAIYILVLSTSLIVAVLALTALMTVRVQRAQATNTAHLRKARAAGIEISHLTGYHGSVFSRVDLAAVRPSGVVARYV